MTDTGASNVLTIKPKPKGKPSGYVKVTEEDQERLREFAGLVALGVSGTQAALQTGFAKSAKAASMKATRLLRLPEVRKILDNATQMREDALQDADVDAAWITNRLRQEAESGHVPSARVRALELLGRIKGIYAPEERKVEHTGAFFADIDADDDATPSAGGEEPDLA